MSNHAHHRPLAAEDAPLPPELAAVADTLNAWTDCFRQLRPGPVSFRVDLTDVIREGERETGVQLWVMVPTGPTVVTVPPALALELAAMLERKATDAMTGILTPGTARLHTPTEGLTR